MAKILVACEESQIVTKAMRELGHEAYSCDLEEPSGGHLEWHLQQDVSPLLRQPWDMVLAFPPCTYLACSGNPWFNEEKYGEKALERKGLRELAIKFFLECYNANSPLVAVENPIGTMSTKFRKPDQIIHPYYFGDPQRKATCLWLRGLPKLKHDTSNHAEYKVFKNKKESRNRTYSEWHILTRGLPPKERSKVRSKTYPGIAEAMKQQWGTLLPPTYEVTK